MRLARPLTWTLLALGVLAVITLPLLAVFLTDTDHEEEIVPLTAAKVETYVETGDLAAIRERGKLRILMPPQRPFVEERVEFPLELDREQAVAFAHELGLEPEVTILEDRLELLRALERGLGDLVLARLRPTPELREQYDFSAPLDSVREIVVAGADSGIESPEDLAGKRVAAQQASPHFQSLANLQEEVTFDISTVPDELTVEQMLGLVASGEYDATVADEDYLDVLLPERDDLEAAFPLTKNRPVAWAIRLGSPQLKEALDLFLQQSILTARLGEEFTGDLEEIKERGVLRVLTRNNPVTYFLYRGEQMGFEFELARRFARELGVRMQVIVPREPGLLSHWLLEGRGDMIAASMKVTPERERVLDFTRSYNQVSELVVTRAGEEVRSFRDLAGRELYVQRSSTYFPQLMALRRQWGFEIVEVSEDLESEEMIDAVSQGEFDLTMVDSNMLDVDLTWRDDVESAFPLGDPVRVSWAVRPGNGELLRTADSFLAEQKGSAFFNNLREKYFTDRETIAKVIAERPREPGELSPFDDVFRKWGRVREIDWRLLTSQAYQESRFDPLAKSWAGALGLMQIMPQTGRELGADGVADLRKPDRSVELGSLYLKRLIGQFDSEISYSERIRFALASYNAGRGHVIDARTLAEEKGYDRNLWYGNVAEVMPLLAKRSYARRARHGYCRCNEPVWYVRKIDERYLAYVQLLDVLYGPEGTPQE